MSTLPAEVGVPGRIEANQDRQVEIRPRATGVVREVQASLGQKVKKGQTLVVLDSPDVGTARLNLRAKQRELATVRTEADWKNQVAANVAALIPELRRKRTEAAGRSRRSSPTGRSGRSAPRSCSRPTPSSRSPRTRRRRRRACYRDKIVGEHPAFLAKHTREGSQAKFEAVLEQAPFDANQQKPVADQQVKLAEAAVIDAAQRLRILGVAEDIDDLLAQRREGLHRQARPTRT